MRAAKLALITATLAACASGASATDCPGARNSLSRPSTPCPQKKPSAREAEKREAEKKRQPPGTYQYGNTTITIGGSVSGGASTRLK